VTEVTGNHTENIFTQEQLNRNVRIFQLTGIDITVLVVPVLVLIWVNAKLTFDEIVMLQGIFMLAIFLFEVPSGSLADYWSRKGSTALFHLIFGAGIFFYAIGNTFEMFAIAEFLAGVGLTFKTGSDNALVYDSLLTRNDNPNGQFGRIMSNRMTLMFVSAAVGALVGGILAEISILRLPIYITFFGHIGFACITYFGYIEPPRLKPKSPRVAIKTAFNSLLHKRELQLILIILISATVFTSLGFWASQHLLIEEFSISPFGIGIFISVLNICAAVRVLNICAAVSSFAVRSQVTRLANFQILFVILILDGIYLLALIPVVSVVGILAVSIIGQITRGSRTPLTQSLMQNNLASNERATFNSLISLIGALMYFVLSGFINLLNLTREQSLELGLLGITILATIFLLLTISRFSTQNSGTQS